MMIIPCLLDEIENDIARLYDYKNKTEYHVALDTQQAHEYTDMLADAHVDQLLNPIVFYDTALEQLVSMPEDDDRFTLFY